MLQRTINTEFIIFLFTNKLKNYAKGWPSEFSIKNAGKIFIHPTKNSQRFKECKF